MNKPKRQKKELNVLIRTSDAMKKIKEENPFIKNESQIIDILVLLYKSQLSKTQVKKAFLKIQD